MKMSNTAFADIIQVGLAQIILLLVGLDILVIALAVILFPFLWKD
jgi:heme exporter protein B